MIFDKHHIDLIREDIKTETRRLERGSYQIGRSYSVQPCRTCAGVADMRIVMDDIYFENVFKDISVHGALREGNYTPKDYETLFEKLYRNWRARGRWVFEFHKISVWGENSGR